MSLFPQSVIRDDYLDLRQTTKVFWMKMIVAVLIVLAVVWFKNNILGYFAQAVGMDALVALLRGPIYLVLAFGFLGIVAGYLLLQLRAIRYQVYKDRVVVTGGVIQRKSLTVRIDQFPQVEVVQGLMGRIFNYGTILFQYGPISSIKDIMVALENVNDPSKLAIVLRNIFGVVDFDNKNQELKELK